VSEQLSFDGIPPRDVAFVGFFDRDRLRR